MALTMPQPLMVSVKENSEVSHRRDAQVDLFFIVFPTFRGNVDDFYRPIDLRRENFVNGS